MQRQQQSTCTPVPSTKPEATAASATNKPKLIEPTVTVGGGGGDGGSDGGNDRHVPKSPGKRPQLSPDSKRRSSKSTATSVSSDVEQKKLDM